MLGVIEREYRYVDVSNMSEINRLAAKGWRVVMCVKEGIEHLYLLELVRADEPEEVDGWYEEPSDNEEGE